MLTNIVIIAIVAVLCVYGVMKFKKNVSSGCCGTGDDEKKVRVKDKDKSNYPYCAKLTVEGMTCNHCREKVENTLNSEEGCWATVDLDSKTATVRMKKEIPQEEFERVIRHAGYTLTGMEAVTE